MDDSGLLDLEVIDLPTPAAPPPEPPPPTSFDELDLPPPTPATAARKKHPPARALLDLLNKALAAPWTADERRLGRCLAREPIAEQFLEFVLDYYRKAGWRIVLEYEPTEGDFLRFLPEEGDAT